MTVWNAEDADAAEVLEVEVTGCVEKEEVVVEEMVVQDVEEEEGVEEVVQVVRVEA